MGQQGKNLASLNNAVGYEGEALSQFVVQQVDAIKTDNALDGDYLLNEDFREHLIAKNNTPAAVLITMVERSHGFNLILTRRTEKLKSHSGQIALPGGKIDAQDADATAAALREAEEEIGLEQSQVQVLGKLPDYISGSGYRIAPVIGMVRSEIVLQANPDEVDEIFEVPLDFIMNRENHVIGSRVFQGRERYFYEMFWQDYKIWGVTAGILKVFQERIFP